MDTVFYENDMTRQVHCIEWSNANKEFIFFDSDSNILSKDEIIRKFEEKQKNSKSLCDKLF